MADKETLDNLIEGLAGAVVEAQQRIETHQINNFLNYFDEDRRPKKIDILMPSLHPDAKGEDVRYRVPLLHWLRVPYFGSRKSRSVLIPILWESPNKRMTM